MKDQSSEEFDVAVAALKTSEGTEEEQVNEGEIERPVVTMDDVDHREGVHQAAVKSVSVVGEVHCGVISNYISDIIKER